MPQVKVTMAEEYADLFQGGAEGPGFTDFIEQGQWVALELTPATQKAIEDAQRRLEKLTPKASTKARFFTEETMRESADEEENDITGTVNTSITPRCV